MQFRNRTLLLLILEVHLSLFQPLAEEMKSSPVNIPSNLAPCSMLLNPTGREGSFPLKSVVSQTDRMKQPGAVNQILERMERSTDFLFPDYKDLAFITEQIQKNPGLSAYHENRIFNQCLKLLRNSDKRSNRHQMAFNILTLLLKKWNVPDLSRSPEYSSTSENFENQEGIKQKPELQVKTGLIRRIFNLITGRSLFSKDLLEKIRSFESETDVSFTRAFSRTRKWMAVVTGASAVVQFFMLVSTSFLTAASVITPGVFLFWLGSIGAFYFLDVIRQKLERDVDHQVDEVLGAGLLPQMGERYENNLSKKVTINKIPAGEKGRWFLIRLLLTGFICSAAFVIMNPVLLCFFIPIYLAAVVWIFIAGFNSTGMDDAQIRYRQFLGRFKMFSIVSEFLKLPVNRKNCFRSVDESQKKYQNRTIQFTSILVFLIYIALPVTGIILGMPAFAFAVSGYLGFMVQSHTSLREISRSDYETEKLKEGIAQILNSERKKWELDWENQWRNKFNPADKDLLEKGGRIVGLRFKDITLNSPGENPLLLVDQQSFSIDKKEVFLFASRSGSGKSQIGKMMSFLRPCNKGQILLKILLPDGHTQWIPADPVHFKLESLRQALAYHSLKNPDESVLNTLHIQCSFLSSDLEKNMGNFQHSMQEENIFIGEIKDLFPDLSESQLREKISHNFSSFSDGQRRRLMLAFVLKQAEKNLAFLVLDEPFARIDSYLEETVCQYLNKWRKKTGIGLIILDHQNRRELNPGQIKSISGCDLIDYIHIEKQQEMIRLLNEKLPDLYKDTGSDFMERAKTFNLPLEEMSSVFSYLSPAPEEEGVPCGKDKKDEEENQQLGFEFDPDLQDKIIDEYSRLVPGSDSFRDKISAEIRMDFSFAALPEEKQLYYEIETAACLLKNSCQSHYPVSLTDDFLKLSDLAIHFKLRTELLTYRSRDYQKMYRRILKQSSKPEDRLFLEFWKTWEKTELTPLFDSAFFEWMPALLKTIDNTGLKEYQPLKTNLVHRNRIWLDKQLRLMMKDVFQKTFSTLAKETLGTETDLKIPASANLADYFYIRREMQKWGCNPSEKTESKAIFYHTWPVFHLKASLLKKYGVPVKSTTLRWVKQKKTSRENERNIKILSDKQHPRQGIKREDSSMIDRIKILDKCWRAA